MPIADVYMLPLDDKDANILQTALTAAFVKVAGAISEDVMIVIHEAPSRRTFIGGKNLQGSFKGPCRITVGWYYDMTRDPDQSLRGQLAEALTEAAVPFASRPEQVEIDFRYLIPGEHYEGGKPAGKPFPRPEPGCA